MFLFPVFLHICSFIVPFMDDYIFFVKSIFDFLLLLIIDLCHVFSQLFLSIVRDVCEHFKASWIIIQNAYFVLLVPDYLLVRSVITGLEYLGSRGGRVVQRCCVSYITGASN